MTAIGALAVAALLQLSLERSPESGDGAKRRLMLSQPGDSHSDDIEPILQEICKQIGNTPELAQRYAEVVWLREQEAESKALESMSAKLANSAAPALTTAENLFREKRMLTCLGPRGGASSESYPYDHLRVSRKGGTDRAPNVRVGFDNQRPGEYVENYGIGVTIVQPDLQEFSICVLWKFFATVPPQPPDCRGRWDIDVGARRAPSAERGSRLSLHSGLFMGGQAYAGYEHQKASIGNAPTTQILLESPISQRLLVGALLQFTPLLTDVEGWGRGQILTAGVLLGAQWYLGRSLLTAAGTLSYQRIFFDGLDTNGFSPAGLLGYSYPVSQRLRLSAQIGVLTQASGGTIEHEFTFGPSFFTTVGGSFTFGPPLDL